MNDNRQENVSRMATSDVTSSMACASTRLAMRSDVITTRQNPRRLAEAFRMCCEVTLGFGCDNSTLSWGRPGGARCAVLYSSPLDGYARQFCADAAAASRALRAVREITTIAAIAMTSPAIIAASWRTTVCPDWLVIRARCFPA